VKLMKNGRIVFLASAKPKRYHSADIKSAPKSWKELPISLYLSK